MTHVTACIDGSASAPAVCDYAAWASQRLEALLPSCMCWISASIRSRLI